MIKTKKFNNLAEVCGFYKNIVFVCIKDPFFFKYYLFSVHPSWQLGCCKNTKNTWLPRWSRLGRLSGPAASLGDACTY